jgi:histidyl-tRNA synthetase
VKLTTAQKREICVLFFSGEKTKSDLAKKFNVSHTAISKILNDEKVAESFKKFGEDKQKEETLSMLAFMESKNGQAQSLISDIMDELKLSLKEKMKRSSLRDCVNAIELLAKTFTFSGDKEKNSKEALEEIVNAINGVSNQ